MNKSHRFCGQYFNVNLILSHKIQNPFGKLGCDGQIAEAQNENIDFGLEYAKQAKCVFVYVLG